MKQKTLINFMWKQVNAAYNYYKNVRNVEEMINAFGTNWGDDGLEYCYYINNLINVNEQLEFINKNKNNTSAMAYLHYMNMYRNYKRTFKL